MDSSCSTSITSAGSDSVALSGLWLAALSSEGSSSTDDKSP